MSGPCSQPDGTAIISHHFNPPYMVFSYLVSLIGCWTTLEILERQTATRGGYNWSVIILASITMTSVGIWYVQVAARDSADKERSMHFVGNSALVIGEGTNQSLICYDITWTIGSLILPVIVVGVAFLIFSLTQRANWFVIVFGGLASGAAICGMHFSGQIGISNYENIFDWRYVVGSGVLSCIAAGSSLGIFFWLKGTWKNNWWKRGINAAFLAASVSSMHWVAMVGTSYRPKTMNNTPRIPNVWAGLLCGLLAVLCSFLLLGIIITWHRVRRQNVQQSQEITIASVCFNSYGHLLVSHPGYLPCKKVDNNYIEQDSNDAFEVGHTVFLWLFRASRYWASIEDLVPQMRRHLREDALLRRVGKSRRFSWNEDPEYLKKFKERMAIAALDLKSALNNSLEDVGVLYDKIIYTGTIDDAAERSVFGKVSRSLGRSKHAKKSSGDSESARRETIGRGQMLFLVRNVTASEQSDLESLGFAFRPLSVCAEGLARSLRVTPAELSPVLRDLQVFNVQPAMLEPGVYVAALAVKPTFSGSKWSILVQKQARNLLPLVKLDQPRLERGQIDLLNAVQGKSADSLFTKLRHGRQRVYPPPGPEETFLGKLFDALSALRARIGLDIFSTLQLAGEILPGPVRVPFEPGQQTTTAMVIGFCGIVDLHHVHPIGAPDEFVASKMVIANQKVYPMSLNHIEFANSVRDEFELVQNFRPMRNSSSARSHISRRLTKALKSALSPLRRTYTAQVSHSLVTITPSPSLPSTVPTRRTIGSITTRRASFRSQKLDIHVSNQINVDVESVDSSQSEDQEVETGEYGVSSHVEAGTDGPSMVETFLYSLLEKKQQSIPYFQTARE